MKKLFMMLLMGAVIASCSDDDDNAAFEIANFPTSRLLVETTSPVSFSVKQGGSPQVTVNKPEGWSVDFKENNTKVQIAAPSATASGAEYSGTISIEAYDGTTRLQSYSVPVQAVSTLTFEDVPSKYLAGPTAAGANLYSGYSGAGGQYTGYTDSRTGLKWGINEKNGDIDFMNGGIAVSQWNDMLDETYKNQCSAYHSEVNTGNGGVAGSKTFAVATGMESSFSDYSSIGFEDATTEMAFDHVWVTNTTYAYMAMFKGNDFAKALSYETKDWFKLIITGYDAAGNRKGMVDAYLADFRTDISIGLIHSWIKVDLTPLGKVHRLEFSFDGSDKDPVYGLNTPTYACFDNLTMML